jgi:hypothetical protein
MTEWDWYDDIPTFRLFIHLLFSVNWEDKKWHGEVIKRGEIITSQSSLAEQTLLTIKQVRRALDNLKMTGEIKVESTNRFTKIKVVNYTKYQDKGRQKTRQNADKQKNIAEIDNTKGKQRANKGQTKGKQRATTKEYNTLNTFNNNISSALQSNTDVTVYNTIKDLFNSTCKSLPQVKMISKSRKTLIDARLQDYTIDDFKKVFTLAEKSDFLSGRNGKWTNCNFDWLIKSNNFLKVIEGTYKNGNKQKIQSHSYDFDELERQIVGGKKC